MTDEPLALPTTVDAWPEFIREWSSSNLRRSELAIAALTDGSHRTADAVLELWDESELGLRNASGFVGLLAEVHPDEGAREIAEKCGRLATRAYTERGLNEELYAVLRAVDGSRLDAGGARLLARVLRDFRRSGSGLDAEARDRIRAISERTNSGVTNSCSSAPKLSPSAMRSPANAWAAARPRFSRWAT